MSYDKEVWKDIKGYEGLYQVSNLGRVKSLQRTCKGGHNCTRIVKEKILKQCYCGIDRDYLNVKLCKDSKIKTIQVHRLVAQAFIPNPDNLPQVNHKNEFEKWNNSVDNLEWCTAKYNNNYGTRIIRATKNRDYIKKVKNTNYKLAGIKSGLSRSKKVYQYDMQYNLIKIWGSSVECGKDIYIQSCVNACCLKKRKTHKGYIWSYERL